MLIINIADSNLKGYFVRRKLKARVLYKLEEKVDIKGSDCLYDIERFEEAL